PLHQFRTLDVRKHDLAFLRSSSASDLFPDLPPTLLQLIAAARTLLIRLFRTHSQTSCGPNCRSNPIAYRVRRTRQRLPPSLLTENASIMIFPTRSVCPRRFRSRLATIPPDRRIRPARCNADYNYAHT